MHYTLVLKHFYFWLIKYYRKVKISSILSYIILEWPFIKIRPRVIQLFLICISCIRGIAIKRKTTNWRDSKNVEKSVWPPQTCKKKGWPSSDRWKKCLTPHLFMLNVYDLQKHIKNQLYVCNEHICDLPQPQIS